jgi:hypothetical protein
MHGKNLPVACLAGLKFLAIYEGYAVGLIFIF